ncbi:MAG: protein kinase domain-containing protein [Planctomycetota bacterium]
MSDPERVEEIVGRWREACDGGAAVDPEEIIRRHPDLAEDLRERFAVIHAVDRIFHQTALRDEAPEQIGDYRIVREIGRGGMGVVYEAEQTSLGRRVALKVLPFAAVLDPNHLQRFKNEAQAAAHLHHTNIVPVHAVGCERGIHFYAMQFIDGQSLAELIEELQGTPGDCSAILSTITSDGSHETSAFFQSVAGLGIQAAEALDHAHQQGVVHRDIKPANLLVDRGGQLWITDFGLALFQKDAALTMTGDLLGTLRYMSPEQAMAKRVPLDHRSDIYSLGVTLYELVTLRFAFDGEDPQEVLRQISFEEPQAPRRLNPALPTELETILLKAIAKNPADRYETAQEMADDLRRFLEHKPVHARRPTLLDRAMKWAWRHRIVVAAGAAVLLVALAAAIVSALLIGRKHEEAEEARAAAEDNLHKAIESIDRMLTRVARDELRDVPRMEEIRRGLYEDALALYRDLMHRRGASEKLRVETGAALSRLAGLLWRLGENESAEQGLHDAIDLLDRAGDSVAARMALANACQRLGRLLWTDARKSQAVPWLRREQTVFEELAREFPDQPRYLYGQARVWRTLWVAGEGDVALQRALDLAERVVALDPSVDSRALLATVYSDASLAREPVDRAEAMDLTRKCVGLLREVLKEDPGRVQIRGNLGMAVVNLAEWLHEAGRHDEAEPYYREGIDVATRLAEDYPKLVLQRSRLGVDWASFGALLAFTGRPQQAEEAWRKALEIQRPLVEQSSSRDIRRCLTWTLIFAGDWLAESGRRTEAEAHYREALDHHAPREDHESRRDRARGLHHLARLLHLDGRVEDASRAWDEALTLLDEHVTLHPEDSPGWELAARLRAACPDASFHDPVRAVELASKAVERSPAHATGWQALGMAQYRAGDMEAALAAFDRAMEQRNGGDSFEWFFVAMAHRRLGHDDDSRRWYDRAVEWMTANQPTDLDLVRYRTEAAEQLSLPMAEK